MSAFERFVFRRVELWVLLLVALLVTIGAFVWGAWSIRTNSFPISAIREIAAFVKAEDEIRGTSLWEKIESDSGLKPSRYLHDSRSVPSFPLTRVVDGAEIFEESRLAPVAAYASDLPDHLILIYGVFEFRDGRFGALLLDPKANRIVRHWVVAPDKLSGNPIKAGFDAETGILFFNFDAEGIAAVDFCGTPVWARPEVVAHHSIESDGRGSIWHFDRLNIVRSSIDTGEQQQQFSLLDVIRANPDNTLLHARLLQEGWHLEEVQLWDGAAGSLQEIGAPGGKKVSDKDPFHANDIEPLPEATIRELGFDLKNTYVAISLRAINAVIIVEVESHDIVASLAGRTSRQHDIDFNPDGSVTIFDNNNHIGPVRIVRWDIDSGEVAVVVDGAPLDHVNPAHGNYSWIEPDTFLVADMHGRAYITRDNVPVMIFDNRYGDGQSLEVRNVWALERATWEHHEAQCQAGVD